MNILGISAYYHDSAACLVRDGRQVPFVYDLVPSVDLETGTITVNAIPGLTD